MRAARYFRPLLPRASDYRRLKRTWKGDLVAGVTVAVVALPLALAFGVSSGAGAEAGLVTAIVAGIVAAVFGGSSIQVSGPTGAMVVVLGPIVASHGAGAVAIVSVMAGVIVLVAGIAKFGRLIAYIPWPVMEGFTLGIAIIIFLQQVPTAIGVSVTAGGNAVITTVQSLARIAWPSVGWSLLIVAIVAVIMVLGPRIHKQFPASIVAVVVAAGVTIVSGAPLATIGELPAALPAPALPTVSLGILQQLVVPALTVAALAAIESLLSARVATSLSDTGPYDGDRELVGQGLASIAAGIFGGMPATGAIARTAVNVRAGAQTRAAAVVHALVLLAVVYVASGVVASIPLAALAGVLMVTATRMVTVATVRSLVGSTRGDTVVFVVTALVTVSFDLIVAVAIGCGVAALLALRSLAQSAGVHREDLPTPAASEDRHIALFRVDGALFFGAADRVLERVTSITDVSVVILRLSQLDALDATGAKALTETIDALQRRGITVLVKGIQLRHMAVATHVGVIAALPDESHLFTDLEAAVDHARALVAAGQAR